MTFKILSAILIFALASASQSVFGQTVETSTESILKNKGKVLPETYERVLTKLTESEQRLSDPEPVFRKLVVQQQETLDSIGSLQARSWFWLTNARSTKPSLMLAEHLYLSDPFCSKVFNWFPKKGVEQVGIEPRHENFDLFSVKIQTPEMVVSSFAFARKGIDEISVKDAKPNGIGRDIRMLLFQYGSSPKDFFEQIKAATNAGRSQYDIRVNGDLLELASWPSSSSREKSRKWIFDTSHGGLLVQHENNLVSTMNLIVEMNHVEVEGRWLPSELVIERINRKAKKIDSREEHEFFELNLIDRDAVDHKEYEIRSLPVKDGNVRINDGRNGVIRTYKFKELE
jgi:hypothetical protein